MGDPLPEISPPSSIDNYCWLNNFFNNPAETPTFITVEIAGVMTGDLWVITDPDPPNGRYVLIEDIPTEWIFGNGTVLIGVAWTSGGTQLFMYFASPVFETLFNEFPGICKVFSHSTYTSPVGRHFYSGTFKILGVS